MLLLFAIAGENESESVVLFCGQRLQNTSIIIIIMRRHSGHDDNGDYYNHDNSLIIAILGC